MKTNWRRLLFVLLALLCASWMAACGAEPTTAPTATVLAQAPSDSPVAPTDTAVPPTNTPLPPTDTPLPPTDTATPPTDTPPPPTDTSAPPTDTPLPPTDTPAPATNTPAPTALPTEAATAAPQATNTPKPPPKPKAGRILLTSNRVSWDDVFVMNDDGSELKQLTKMGKCYDAVFTPDGKTIFFEHDDDLWKMNPDGSGQTNLTNTTDNIEGSPVVAPDGSRVAYLFAWPGGFEIYSMKLDGTDRKPVTSRDFDLMPAWSPDSKKIAFASVRNGSFNIWVVNRDGTDLKQVTQFGPERIAITPVFAPDGKRIAFSTITADTAWEIWVVNLDGSNAHKVVGTVGQDKNNSTGIVAWKKGKFLIAGWEGNWAPYFVPDSGGDVVKLLSGAKDDKASDWWLP